MLVDAVVVDGDGDDDLEEKKRKAKAKAAEREMQVIRIREMKRGLLLEEEEEEDREEESVLKERRAVEEGESWSSSSWVGNGVGFVEVNADRGSEPILSWDEGERKKV